AALFVQFEAIVCGTGAHNPVDSIQVGGGDGGFKLGGFRITKRQALLRAARADADQESGKPKGQELERHTCTLCQQNMEWSKKSLGYYNTAGCIARATQQTGLGCIAEIRWSSSQVDTPFLRMARKEQRVTTIRIPGDRMPAGTKKIRRLF